MLADTILALASAVAASRVGVDTLLTILLALSIAAFLCAAALLVETAMGIRLWLRAPHRAWWKLLPALLPLGAGVWAVVVGWQSAAQYRQITAIVQPLLAACGQNNARCVPAPLVLMLRAQINDGIHQAIVPVLALTILALLVAAIEIWLSRRQSAVRTPKLTPAEATPRSGGA